MTFPTLDSALNYIKGKLQDFYNQSYVLKDRLLTIGRLMNEAKKRNAQESIGQLIVLRTQTEQTFKDQLDLEQRLMPFASYFGTRTTLGAIPVILAVVGVSVASLMYLHFEKLRNQGKALELVAKGFMTPAEADSILSKGLFDFGGGFSMIWILLLGGGVLFLSGWMKRA